MLFCSNAAASVPTRQERAGEGGRGGAGPALPAPPGAAWRAGGQAGGQAARLAEPSLLFLAAAQEAWVLVAEKIDSGENPPCPLAATDEL